jgi:hypothetical protein
MEMQSVEDVMAEGPDSTAERRDSGKSVPALPWEAANEEGPAARRYAPQRDRRPNRATGGRCGEGQPIDRLTAPISSHPARRIHFRRSGALALDRGPARLGGPPDLAAAKSPPVEPADEE